MNTGVLTHDFDIRLPSTRLSNEARRAMTVYSGEAHGFDRTQLYERTNRVLGTLAMFAGDNLPARAFDAAALMPLARQLDEGGPPLWRQAAAKGLREYFSGSGIEGKKSNSYVGTLLGDMPHLDSAADAYKKRLPEAYAAMLEGEAAIPLQSWLSFRVGSDIPVIAQTHRVTNVESQLLKAADTIDEITHAPARDPELLDRIIRAESSYSAPLEIYGFHAFDMLLQSVTRKVRVYKSGNEEVLAHAAEFLDGVKDIEVEDILGYFFDQTPKQYAFQTAKDTSYNESIVFSSIPLAEVSHNVQEGELHARFKTVGKYALKLLENPYYGNEMQRRPADVFGMLSVLPDEDQLATLFTRTIEKAARSSSISFVKAPSKDKPFFIQGSSEYVRHVCRQLPPDILRQVEVRAAGSVSAEHTYQVAKFTCLLRIGEHELPIEFQFQTAADRANARLGALSHMSHNAKMGDMVAGIVPGSPDDLRTIYGRKYAIDKQGERVNGHSIPHGEEFRRLYLLARGSIS